jgi:hypothetical protein
MRRLLWLLLLASIAFPLLFALGCGNRDNLIDAGPTARPTLYFFTISQTSSTSGPKNPLYTN